MFGRNKIKNIDVKRMCFNIWLSHQSDDNLYEKITGLQDNNEHLKQIIKDIEKRCDSLKMQNTTLIFTIAEIRDKLEKVSGLPDVHKLLTYVNNFLNEVR